MTTPQFQLIPLRAAVASDQPTTLDVLVKIIPPLPETRPQRPPLNLGLVIDRSGSMQRCPASRLFCCRTTPAQRSAQRHNF